MGMDISTSSIIMNKVIRDLFYRFVCSYFFCYNIDLCSKWVNGQLKDSFR